jgi:hypothetical protein
VGQVCAGRGLIHLRNERDSPEKESTMTELRKYLTTLRPGEVPASSGLDRLLAAHWDEFEGSDEGGM